MTRVDVRVIGDTPLVQLSGAVTERSGAELAAAVMGMIHAMTDDPDEYGHPLSLPQPRVPR